VITLGPIMLGVFVLDLLALGALLWTRGDIGETQSGGEELDGFAETEVGHFH
jgi:hypothetical protein